MLRLKQILPHMNNPLIELKIKAPCEHNLRRKHKQSALISFLAQVNSDPDLCCAGLVRAALYGSFSFVCESTVVCWGGVPGIPIYHSFPIPGTPNLGTQTKEKLPYTGHSLLIRLICHFLV